MIDAKERLWLAFSDRIKAEWKDNYSKYGSHLDDAKSSFALAKSVNDSMAEVLQRNEGLVSTHTLHRYLKDGKFPAKVSLKVLDAFAQYIGYESYEEFDAATENSIQSGDTHSFYGLNSKKGWAIFAGFLLLAGCLSNYWYEYTRNKVIINLIKAANEAELDVYKSLSDSSEVALYQYFIESGTALGQIKGVVERSRMNNRKLLVPPSSYSLMDIEILKRKNSVITVQTEESWLLRWYDDSLKKELLYDVSNEHVYFILKEDNQWKIATDVYTGAARIPVTEQLQKQ